MNEQSLNLHWILTILANEGDLQSSKTQGNNFQRDSENSSAKPTILTTKITQSPAVMSVATLKWSLMTNFVLQRFLWGLGALQAYDFSNK